MIYLTDRISKPILRLQYATEKIARVKIMLNLKITERMKLEILLSHSIKWPRTESSKNKLKKAEREAAWRDIARRVAHEIKNPLTQMKLSIEHLYDMYRKDSNNNFPEVLKKTKYYHKWNRQTEQDCNWVFQFCQIIRTQLWKDRSEWNHWRSGVFIQISSDIEFIENLGIDLNLYLQINRNLTGFRIS